MRLKYLLCQSDAYFDDGCFLQLQSGALTP